MVAVLSHRELQPLFGLAWQHEMRLTHQGRVVPEFRVARTLTNPGAHVKAILHTRYGPPDLLQFMELDKPVPKNTEILIRVHATTVSTGDCNIRNFTCVTKSMLPLAKLMFGIGKPWRHRILGTELAGEVVTAGKNVTRFRAGTGSLAQQA